MSGVNKAILIGNLGAEPELRYTQANDAVLKFRIATTEVWYDGDTKEKKETTYWHNCVMWGKRGEALSKFLAKGSKVYVEGRIENRTYDDKDGLKRYITEINVRNLELLDGRRDSNASADGDAPRGNGGRPAQGVGNGGSRNAPSQPQRQQARAEQTREQIRPSRPGNRDDEMPYDDGNGVPSGVDEPPPF